MNYNLWSCWASLMCFGYQTHLLCKFFTNLNCSIFCEFCEVEIVAISLKIFWVIPFENKFESLNIYLYGRGEIMRLISYLPREYFYTSNYFYFVLTIFPCEKVNKYSTCTCNWIKFMPHCFLIGRRHITPKAKPNTKTLLL